MRTAHQAVPVVALPGVSGGPLIAAARRSAASRTTPPAPMSNAEGPVPGRAADGGIDNWLINRLFGRR